MSLKIHVSEEIERPIAVVFKFWAEDHVRNHPRWDPYIELRLDSDAPIGVGTVIRRRNSRSGTPVEGTMEVVEYEPNRAIGMLTRDGPMEIPSRATFESLGPDLTRLTLDVEMKGMDDSMQGFMTGAVQQGLRTVKELMEAET
ncbi:MAG TPA: SRPBCC family protein [Promineifilum sp.]